MTTQAQSEASRKNGAMGHGPVTPEGKERSSRNALRHGLAAEKFTVMDEEEADFESYRRDFLEDLQPADALEGALAERVISLNWRLRRAAWMEAGLIRADQWAAHRRDTEGAPQKVRQTWKPPPLSVVGRVLRESMSGPRCAYEVLGRYERRLERGFLEAVRELRALRKERMAAALGGADARCHARLRRDSLWRTSSSPREEACPAPAGSGPNVVCPQDGQATAPEPAPGPAPGESSTPEPSDGTSGGPLIAARSNDPRAIHPDSVRYLEEAERSGNEALREVAARVRAKLGLPAAPKS